VWKEASEAMYDKLKSITLADLAAKAGAAKEREIHNVL
jgi:DNA-binding IscR family transcriptional regulator